MSKKIVVLLFIVIGILQSCNTTEPPLTEKTITLTLEDAASIEAWIKITTNNLQLPTTITLKQSATGGNSVTQDIILSYADTVIYIDSLLPNTTYNFQASSHSGLSGISSNKLQVTTMDTTSHNFTWQTFTFGEHSSSVLYDVAIIDPDNIWAVGEIYLNDSLGNPDPNAYNAIHWDGSEWNIKRIPFIGTCSAVIYPPIRSIFAFSDDDIWYARGGSLVHFDGTEYYNDCGMNSFLTGSINKIWGTSSSDLYIVGNNGNIAWYNGSVWTKIESGTELNINDIWGEYNEKTGEWEILAVASNILQSFEKEVIKINENDAGLLNKEGIDWTLSSIWFIPNRKYYAVGSGIYQKNQLSEIEWKDDSISRITNYHVNRIRANYMNDVVIVGAFGEILHFSGYSWKSYFSQTHINGSYKSVTIINNLIIAVGQDAPKAAIIIGTR